MCKIEVVKMSGDRDREEGGDELGHEKTFILSEAVHYGYNTTCSQQIEVSHDRLTATKRDPGAYYAYGVAYGEKPLRGTAEFEVELVSYGTGWSGTLKLGVMRCQTGQSLQSKTIPRYSPEGTHHCVWSSDKLHNRLTDCFTELHYGSVNLDDLRDGDRLGMRLTHSGELMFFVNGKHQGVAAENVYQKGYDVYPIVDHYANCKATRITRAVMHVDIRLQDICLRVIAGWLHSQSEVGELPLPKTLKQRLLLHIQ